MKIRIDWDERYPEYSPDDEGRVEIEVPDDFMRKWKRVSRQYEELQTIMREAHDAARA